MNDTNRNECSYSEKPNSSDTISRQAAIDAVNKALDRQTLLYGFVRKVALDAIKNLPSAQPERKTGKWINGVCDQCGSHAPYWAMASTYYRSSFCPNCGADMRKREGDNV